MRFRHAAFTHGHNAPPSRQPASPLPFPRVPKPLDDTATSTFPQWVAWGSLVLALALFFGNTTDALREQDDLARLRAEILTKRMEFDDALARARPGTPGMAGDQEDLQSLLVAIDRLGYTPAELLQHYPEPPPTPTPDGDDAPPVPPADPSSGTQPTNR